MGKRTEVEVRERVAVMLREGVSAEVRRAYAKEHGKSLRTLRNWRRGPAGRWGRPPRPEALVQAARADCARELLARGHGRWWKTIWVGLGGLYAQALVREVVTDLKEEHEARGRLLRAMARVSVKAFFGDVLWALDETHLGRLEDGEAVLGLVVREVASTRTLIVSVGPAATAEDLVRALEVLRLSRGGLPLVICMDNGPAMKSELVELYLRFHEVVPLRNLPYVSEHNAYVERGHRDIKEMSGLGKSVVLSNHAEAARALVPALTELNEYRPVASRGWRTPVAVDNETPRWYASVDRRDFYEAACRAIREAVQGCRNDRERRKAEREAILSTLENFALIQRTRGGVPISPR
jgi:hypothetical protein